jgi:hypothetical protein
LDSTIATLDFKLLLDITGCIINCVNRFKNSQDFTNVRTNLKPHPVMSTEIINHQYFACYNLELSLVEITKRIITGSIITP